jgi:hypothetical protein
MSILFRLNKGRGILVLLYLIVCLIGTAVLIGILNRNVGGIFKRIDFYATAGVAFVFAGIWTYFTRDDYYKDREGNKKKMDTINSFGLISMRIWSFIFFGIGSVLFGNLIFHYFPVAN